MCVYSPPGVLIPVSESSEEFQSCIVAPLKSAYLYEESRQFFRYKSAVLVKNPELEEKVRLATPCRLYNPNHSLNI